jgi:hypothetical protein
VKLAVEIDEVDAPVELLGGFPGSAHETLHDRPSRQSPSRDRFQHRRRPVRHLFM